MQTLIKSLKNLFSSLSFLILIAIFASCETPKDVVYFNNIADTSLTNSSRIPEAVIQSNDILGITISSANPDVDKPFNPQSAIDGYLVDAEGNIQLPTLHNVKAAGLTKNQLKTNITRQLIDKKLLTDPSVNIKFLNFKVTVLGEVANPSVVAVPSEKITILEAIGNAGDLTFAGRRDNILLIREENGKKTFRRLNLNSPAIFTSPYYYLLPNDVIYVEPSKAKIASNSTASRVVPQVLSAVTLALTIATFFIK